ncbi:hypothetical protein Spith_0605 [Spirochaeta thermophila DSM 6578]|uniref:Fido domain-containing protein n=1 Tax=Winmispira thermophila (strain ATCC 700085 / DSM 6578 / Z-1203) TaxID=869211 RepID=G0GA49_WINT7|nr:hypothetical protein [Spirochaeta thermophila]AEJ60885.1 hypothetical protein Spith_0605 [Spirochaeta thermophila DSM 6578]
MPIAGTFCIPRIRESLQGFKKAFPSINRRLSVQREDFTDTLLEHILLAYQFLNRLLSRGIDIFSPAGLYALLEVNHLVMCGNDPATRLSFHLHIEETRRRYQENIDLILPWVRKARGKLPPFAFITEFYIKCLSHPQLFVEGNHRSGNILVNYLLVSEGFPPFIVTPETGYEYLELSGAVKFSSKEKVLDTVLPLKKAKKRLMRLFREHGDARYLA